MKRTKEDKFINGFLIIFMTVIILVTFYPLYYALINSFNDSANIAAKGFIFLIPRSFTLENFKIVFTENTLLNAFKVTVLRTITGTIVSVLFTAVVSYPLSRKYLLFRKAYLRIGIITMYFSGGVIPFYILLNSLHLTNNFLVYIIPLAFSFFNAIIFINFFSEIPDALEESAKIDGANDWYFFIKIVIPLSTPVLATIALFNGVNQWNSWFDAAFYTSDNKLMTLQLLLYQIISQIKGVTIAQSYLGAGQVNLNIIEAIKYATMVVSIVPIAIAYPFLQRFFVKGMMVGSIKG